MAWQKKNYGNLPKKHDHSGFMVWSEMEAFCDDCGQHWAIAISHDNMGKEKRRWVPS